MNAFETDRPARSRLPILFVFVVIIVALVGAAYYLAPRFERESPQIKLSRDTDVLGLAPLEIVVTDQGAGLKSVTATLTTGGSITCLPPSSTPSR